MNDVDLNTIDALNLHVTRDPNNDKTPWSVYRSGADEVGAFVKLGYGTSLADALSMLLADPKIRRLPDPGAPATEHAKSVCDPVNVMAIVEYIITRPGQCALRICEDIIGPIKRDGRHKRVERLLDALVGFGVLIRGRTSIEGRPDLPILTTYSCDPTAEWLWRTGQANQSVWMRLVSAALHAHTVTDR